MKTEDLLKEAIKVLSDKKNYSQLKEIPESVINSNIYVRKAVNIFTDKSINDTSDDFKRSLFDWYKSNLKNTLYSKEYAESLK